MSETDKVAVWHKFHPQDLVLNLHEAAQLERQIKKRILEIEAAEAETAWL